MRGLANGWFTRLSKLPWQLDMYSSPRLSPSPRRETWTENPSHRFSATKIVDSGKPILSGQDQLFISPAKG
jgi:hypothetical protein